MHIHLYQTISESKDGVVEICKTCRKRLVTKKGIKGRIQNQKYLKEHVADFAQKTGRTANIFKKLYGEGIKSN